MKRLRLTKETQKARFLEDVERINAGRRPDFSIGDHLLMLMRRVEYLEARLRDSDGSGETAGLDPKGDSAGLGEASPNPTPEDQKNAR